MISCYIRCDSVNVSVSRIVSIRGGRERMIPDGVIVVVVVVVVMVDVVNGAITPKE